MIPSMKLQTHCQKLQNKTSTICSITVRRKSTFTVSYRDSPAAAPCPPLTPWSLSLCPPSRSLFLFMLSCWFCWICWPFVIRYYWVLVFYDQCMLMCEFVYKIVNGCGFTKSKECFWSCVLNRSLKLAAFVNCEC